MAVASCGSEGVAATAYEMVRDCGCEEGCLACVYDRRCGNANGYLDKRAALVILDRLRVPGGTA